MLGIASWDIIILEDMFQIGSFLESKTLTQFKKRTWFTVQNVQFIEVSTE